MKKVNGIGFFTCVLCCWLGISCHSPKKNEAPPASAADTPNLGEETKFSFVPISATGENQAQKPLTAEQVSACEQEASMLSNCNDKAAKLKQCYVGTSTGSIPQCQADNPTLYQ